MKNRFAWMSAALAAAAVGGFTQSAAASSHREAPAIAADPSADNTDVYAWVNANGNLVVVANYIGLELPEGGPNWAKFSDEVLYQIHLTRGDSLDDAITYQFQFTTAPYAYTAEKPGMMASALKAVPAGGQEFFGQLSGGGAFAQTYSVTKVVNGAPTVIGTGLKVPPPNVGPSTNLVAYGMGATETYENHFIDNAATTTVGTLMNGEGKVFAGPRDDPFYVDLGAVFDLAQVRPVLALLQNGIALEGTPASFQACPGTPPNGPFTCNARDSVRYHNVHSIVLEIPGMVANGGTAVTMGASVKQTVGVWASASRRKVTVLRAQGGDDHYGPWRQVSRLGIPLINETVIGLQDKDYWNRSTPKQDAPVFGGYFDNLIAARDAQAVGYYGASSTLKFCNIQNMAPPLTNRLADIVPIINLTALNAVYNFTTIGDVLRVDLGTPMSDFPNGRRLDTSGTGNTETVDVVDTEVKMLFCTLTNAAVNAALKPGGFGIPNTPYGGIPDGVNANEANFRATFPYLASPWEGFHASPHAPPGD
jgi:hypothetical protein